MGGFFTDPAVVDLEQKKILPIAVGLMVFMILALGVMTMIKPRNFSTIAGNMVIGAIIFWGLPAFISNAYEITNSAINALNSGSTGITQTMSDKILVDNITDNIQYDKEGFKSTTLKQKSYFQAKGADISKIANIDPTEVVDPGKMKYQDIWKSTISYDENGQQSLTPLWDGKIGFASVPAFCQYYYRWNIDWFTIISTMLITAFALIMSAIKIARLLYELVIHQTLAQCLALLDVVTAQRVKKCLQMLLSTFVTLFSVFFMLQLYIIGNAYVANHAQNIFLRLILMLALAWSVIDGPNLFEQIFGIDAGVHNAVRTMYGMKAAGSLLAGGVALAGGKGIMDSLKNKGILGTAKAAVGKVGGLVGGAAGLASGEARGMADNHSRYSAAKNGNPLSGAAKAVKGAATGAVAGVAKAAGDSGVSGSGGKAGPNEKSGGSKSGPGGIMPDRIQDATESQPSASKQENSTGAEKDTNKKPDQNSGQSLENQRTNQHDQSQNSKQFSESFQANQKGEIPRQTLGGYLGGKISKGIQSTGAVRSAKHMYSLTYGTRMAYGDKHIQKHWPESKNGSVKSVNHAVRAVKQEKTNMDGAEKK